VQDISIFDAPQRAMAEALSRFGPVRLYPYSTRTMIPSLASAAISSRSTNHQESELQEQAVGDYGNFMTYGGSTYGVPTDGNVHAVIAQGHVERTL